MTEAGARRASIRELDLTPTQRDALSEVVAASIAVNVYRETARLAGDVGCQIITNCCSCSKAEAVLEA